MRNLDRNEPLQLVVMGQIDSSKSTLAQDSFNAVATDPRTLLDPVSAFLVGLGYDGSQLLKQGRPGGFGHLAQEVLGRRLLPRPQVQLEPITNCVDAEKVGQRRRIGFEVVRIVHRRNVR